MKIESLQEYYNRINACSIRLEENLDFVTVKEQISKTAIYTEDLNRILGEILIEKTKLEHLSTEKTFDYELNFSEFMNKNPEVTKFATGKERKDYINYFLMKDVYRELKNIEQELKDVEGLLELAKKKARDLDRIYPKLKTLWEASQLELKYTKGLGSDSDYVAKVKDAIDKEQKETIPIFTDSTVEEMKNDPYNNMDVEDSEESKNIEINIDDLIRDL